MGIDNFFIRKKNRKILENTSIFQNFSKIFSSLESRKKSQKPTEFCSACCWVCTTLTSSDSGDSEIGDEDTGMVIRNMNHWWETAYVDHRMRRSDSTASAGCCCDFQCLKWMARRWGLEIKKINIFFTVWKNEYFKNIFWRVFEKNLKREIKKKTIIIF